MYAGNLYMLAYTVSMTNGCVTAESLLLPVLRITGTMSGHFVSIAEQSMPTA